MLLNSILYNSCVWYNVSTADLKELSKLDSLFFSRLFCLPLTSPNECFFLEPGALDIETTIKARRIIYYHSLVNRSNRQLVYSYFMTQHFKRESSDWVVQTERDFEDLNIPYNFEFLKSISAPSFKKLVKENAKHFCFKKLVERKQNHSKMRFLVYDKLAIQGYLNRDDITTEQKRMLIKWRINMSLFGENYRQGKATVLCPLCQNHRDFPFYSFICPTVTQRLTIYGKYCDMYNPNKADLPKLMKMLEGIEGLRKSII